MNDLNIVAIVNQDIRLGAYIGVNGTPTVFAYGRILRTRTLEVLQIAVENELKKETKAAAVSEKDSSLRQ